jgi:hypothetical protein
MTIVKFIVTWRNNKPFPIEIDNQKTILDLKKLIAAHHGQTYDQFIIMNGVVPIGNDKNNCTIESCKLNRIVRCTDDYNPGNLL